MPVSPLFLCDDPLLVKRAGALLRRLPPVSGRPVRIAIATGLRDRRGAVHGAAFVRQRRMTFDCTRAEFPRIFVHELFHFVWLRAGNTARHAFEEVIRREWRARASGELGWSAEWRKDQLTAHDVRSRSRRWREYSCESFCDTAAWFYSGVAPHAEFTLARKFRAARAAWFRETIEARGLSI